MWMSCISRYKFNVKWIILMDFYIYFLRHPLSINLLLINAPSLAAQGAFSLHRYPLHCYWATAFCHFSMKHFSWIPYPAPDYLCLRSPMPCLNLSVNCFTYIYFLLTYRVFFYPGKLNSLKDLTAFFFLILWHCLFQF